MNFTDPDWGIPPEHLKKYETMFESLELIGDKVSGPVVSKMLKETKIPVENLRRIWDLADLDQDGCLDRMEFILTMHLICRCLEGEPIPSVLPLNLIPPNKRGGLSEPLAIMPPMMSYSDFNSPATFSTSNLYQSSPPLISVNSISHVVQPTSLPDWRIPIAEQTQFASIFIKMDQDLDGLVSGAEVREFFLQSNLPQPLLAKIWDLVDRHGTGMLNQEQFSVAMHLANEQLASGCTKEIPDVLPPDLIPPSMRHIALDPAIFEESNRLIQEIEKLRRERQNIEAESAALNLKSQMRTTSLSKKQVAEESLLQTSRRLAEQRSSAEKWVSNSIERRNTLQTNHVELTERMNNERVRVEELRERAATQQMTIKTKEEEVSKLRSEISEHNREKAGLLDQITERKERLKVIKAENETITASNEKRQQSVSTLENLRDKFVHAIDCYEKLLSGDTNTVEPDEQLLNSILSEYASFHEFDAHESRNRLEDNFQTFQPNFPNQSDGAASVPLFSMKAADPFEAHSPAQSVLAVHSDPFSNDQYSAAFLPVVSVGYDPFSPQPIKNADPFSMPMTKDTNMDQFDAVFGGGVDSVSAIDSSLSSLSLDPRRRQPLPRPTTQPGPKKHSVDQYAASKFNRESENRRRSTDSPSKLSKLRGVFSKKLDHSSTSSGKHSTSAASANTVPRSSSLRHHHVKPSSHSSIPSAVSEEAQFNWATEESQRSALHDAVLRRQEEVELQRALQLSLVESSSNAPRPFK